MYQKIKRILALSAVAIILLLYVITFFLSFSKNEHAGDWLMIAIVATVVIPVLMYIYLWLLKLFGPKDKSEDEA